MILRSEPDLTVVGEAADGEAAVAAVAELQPDVVLMDIRMPGARRARSHSPHRADSGRPARVLVLTTFDLDEYVLRRAAAGASGFLLKDTRRGPADRGHSGHRRRRRPVRPLGHPPAHPALRRADPDAHTYDGSRLADRAGTRDPQAPRRSAEQRRDRRRALHQRAHGPYPRRPHPGQTAPARPRPGHRRRLRDRNYPTRRKLSGNTSLFAGCK